MIPAMYLSKAYNHFDDPSHKIIWHMAPSWKSWMCQFPAHGQLVLCSHQPAFCTPLQNSIRLNFLDTTVNITFWVFAMARKMPFILFIKMDKQPVRGEQRGRKMSTEWFTQCELFLVWLSSDFLGFRTYVRKLCCCIVAASLWIWGSKTGWEAEAQLGRKWVNFLRGF